MTQLTKGFFFLGRGSFHVWLVAFLFLMLLTLSLRYLLMLEPRELGLGGLWGFFFFLGGGDFLGGEVFWWRWRPFFPCCAPSGVGGWVGVTRRGALRGPFLFTCIFFPPYWFVPGGTWPVGGKMFGVGGGGGVFVCHRFCCWGPPTRYFYS